MLPLNSYEYCKDMQVFRPVDYTLDTVEPSECGSGTTILPPPSESNYDASSEVTGDGQIKTKSATSKRNYERSISRRKVLDDENKKEKTRKPSTKSLGEVQVQVTPRRDDVQEETITEHQRDEKLIMEKERSRRDLEEAPDASPGEVPRRAAEDREKKQSRRSQRLASKSRDANGGQKTQNASQTRPPSSEREAKEITRTCQSPSSIPSSPDDTRKSTTNGRARQQVNDERSEENSGSRGDKISDTKHQGLDKKGQQEELRAQRRRKAKDGKDRPKLYGQPKDMKIVQSILGSGETANPRHSLIYR